MPDHLCPAVHCPVIVRANQLLCRTHWLMVPPAMRREVLDAWAGGHGAGTAAHLVACADAVDAVNIKIEEAGE